MTLTHIIAAALAVTVGLILLRLGVEVHDYTVSFVENLEGSR